MREREGFDLKGVCLRGQPPFLLTALHLLLPPARFRNFRSPIPNVDCRAHILEEPRRVTTKKPGISKFSPPYCARVHESGRVYDTKCEVGCCCCIVPRANYCSIGDGGLARREQLTANFFPFPPENFACCELLLLLQLLINGEEEEEDDDDEVSIRSLRTTGN